MLPFLPSIYLRRSAQSQRVLTVIERRNAKPVFPTCSERTTAEGVRTLFRRYGSAKYHVNGLSDCRDEFGGSTMSKAYGETVIHKVINIVWSEAQEPFRFRNYYQCPYDRAKWDDEWTCTCNDRCPVCNAEIEPHFSEDIEAAYEHTK